jgi:NTE family protein
MPGKDEKVVLVLQGGGALGAYQAGAYEALVDFGYQPDWVAGISIGAINAALIAGNAPGRRVERLREFWEDVSSRLLGEPFFPGSDARALFNETSAALVSATGVPGFFAPRFPPAYVMPPGSPAATSLYDSAPLLETLETLIDFEVLNSGLMRVSVGTVDIESGNFAYFDTADQMLGPQHVMASGALPPGFPAVIIDGEAYWDGGLVSNTPLHYVLDGTGPREDMCVFQIDLFSARGQLPRTLSEVGQREKDIRYSSRTRMNTDTFCELQTLRRAARRLYRKLPENLKNDKDARFLEERACDAAITIVHLIHRGAAYETRSKDYDFSRLSMEEHWRAGGDDVRRTLGHESWQTRAKPAEGVAVFDLTKSEPN